MPDGSVRSPDVAWLCMKNGMLYLQKGKKTFAHVTPDFIAEVMSPADDFKELRNKMDTID